MWSQWWYMTLMMVQGTTKGTTATWCFSIILDEAHSRLFSLLRGKSGGSLGDRSGLLRPGLPRCLLGLLPPPDEELHPGDGDDEVDHHSELDIAALGPGDVWYQHPPSPRHPGQPTQGEELRLLVSGFSTSMSRNGPRSCYASSLMS